MAIDGIVKLRSGGVIEMLWLWARVSIQDCNSVETVKSCDSGLLINQTAL